MQEWTNRMDYNNPKTFRRHFKPEFRINPGRIVIATRLSYIVHDIKKNNSTCDEIAWKYCLPDGKGLSNLLKYHLRCTPTDIREMSDGELEVKMENWRDKFRGKNGG
jgi:methylphosphotriester-DNA--protein-cysteine methyltransferase